MNIICETMIINYLTALAEIKYKKHTYLIVPEEEKWRKPALALQLLWINDWGSGLVEIRSLFTEMTIDYSCSISLALPILGKSYHN